MSRYYLVLIAASCAFGSTFAFGQTLTVGLLEESSAKNDLLIPAGRYEAGTWSEQPARAIPRDWQLWGQDFQGSAVRAVSPCDLEDCWTTDVARRPQRSGQPKVIGAVVSPAAPMSAFLASSGGPVEQSNTEQSNIDAYLAPVIAPQLEARLAREELNPAAIKPAAPQHTLRAEVAGQTYYHILRTSEIYDKKAASHQCEFFRFVFQAWFKESADGVRNLLAVRSQLDDCNGSELTYLQPAGAMMLNGAVFAVAEENYYEGSSAVVLRLNPSSVSRLIRHHWTAD